MRTFSKMAIATSAALLAIACSDAPPGGDATDSGPPNNPPSTTDAGHDAAAPPSDSGPPPTTDAGAEDAGTDAAPIPCTAPIGKNEECRNGLPAPVFQILPAGFAMDVTEVTRAQYAAWLATTPAVAGQAAECSANTAFTPDATCMGNALVCQTGCDTHPQVCVDWCDAQAYCKGLGKQLCGARPDAIEQGTTVGFKDFNNPELDQFQYACSADGKQGYVYADKYDATACNTGCKGAACKTIPVASNPKCQGAQNTSAFPGVYDLNGNVAEWDGLCESTSANAQCHVRGGDMKSTATTSTCDFGGSGGLAARNVGQPSIGFRCCSGSSP